MSHDDRRLVFSSRMSQPFDLQDLPARYPERRIRITDMIGRRGRFIISLPIIGCATRDRQWRQEMPAIDQR